jgi:rhamnogalacturonan endolyase
MNDDHQQAKCSPATLGIMACSIILFGLAAEIPAQMQVEDLKRGLIAVRQGDGYYLSWRLLGHEPYDTGFHVYRDDRRISDEPITKATLFLDRQAPLDSTYTVRALQEDQEMAASEPARMIQQTQGAHAGYFDIPLQRPEPGSHGGTYTPNDASVGDLTGDGHYELVLKWEPSNARDNAQRGITDPVLLDAYTLDGDHLWRIDLGPNIRAGAHYTQFMVYDFDGNGHAELMVKTAPGTRDGTGGLLSQGPAAHANHQQQYRNRHGCILEGPEYLTVFHGRTGAELATVDYVPARGQVSAWGDDYGNRVDRFLAAVAYVDGQQPSAIFCRGYYTRMVLVAWDWRQGQLTHRWTFDTDQRPYNHQRWRGQGNHQLAVVDANHDGRHDIVYGSAVIDGDGQGMHTTGYGHGDALHATHMVKGDPIPKIFMPHELGDYGVTLRHADTGEFLFDVRMPGDIGRGVAAELDLEVPGFKFWAASRLGLFDLQGQVVGRIPNSINHVIWWDGELSRELLDRNQITKWSVKQQRGTRLLDAEGALSINGTKANPSLQVDLLGDWREEVIFRTDDQRHLRVVTTTMPTSHRLVTLMHDPVYRVAIARQNTAYNQPPHPGYYIASDMDFPPPALNIRVTSDNGGIVSCQGR